MLKEEWIFVMSKKKYHARQSTFIKFKVYSAYFVILLRVQTECVYKKQIFRALCYIGRRTLRLELPIGSQLSENSISIGSWLTHGSADKQTRAISIFYTHPFRIENRLLVWEYVCVSKKVLESIFHFQILFSNAISIKVKDYRH